MAKAPAIKPEELSARGYADRLILEQLCRMESAMKLSELADRLSHAGLGLAAVRALLASNPDRFAYHERRWIPATRIAAAGRPFAECVRLIVDRFGGPVDRDVLIRELELTTGQDAENLGDRLARAIADDPSLMWVGEDKVGLVNWGFEATDELQARAYALNKVSAEDVDKLDAILNVNYRTAEGIAEAVKKAAPVSLKVLGAVVWKNLNPEDPRSIHLYDPKVITGQILSVPGFLLSGDGCLSPESEGKRWVTTAIKAAEKLAPTVDVEDAAPIEVKAADIKKMVEKITKSEASVTATKLLEEFYEITPANRTFPDDMANLQTALGSEAGVWWVGGDRYRVPNSAPDFVLSVPEPFQFATTDFVDEEGELVDVELTDEGLNSSLRKLLLHPLAMDVLDEDIAPLMKNQPQQIRVVLKSIHRELGTIPMAQIPTGWLDQDPNIQELIFQDPNGRELQVWANHEARLLYNLIDWWYEQPVECGAVFTLTKTNKPNVLEFAWDDQNDPVVYISSNRMEELRDLQEKTLDAPTLQVLIEVMLHWPKGADFLTLLAEVNVVRRSSRRMIASLLSSYQCFFQRQGSPVWHYDAKKVEAGFDKAKRKFVKKG